jgi:hypothetical protein
MDFEHRDVTQAASGNPLEQRKSDRIRYAFLVQITGTDSAGAEFCKPVHTEVVTRDGGLIVCPVTLSIGDVIGLMRNDRRIQARIVGQVGLKEQQNLFGIQFLDAATDFWGIRFSEPIHDAAGRAVLECNACSTQKIVPLSEIETLVFESTRVIAHECDRCFRQTLWMEPTILGEPELITGPDSYAQKYELRPKRPTSVNDRKHQRITMRNTKACIKRRGHADDVVDVIDLSRGGVRFLSMVDYYKETVVEVAVPYTEGGANVFVPAEIVRVQCRPTVGIPGDFGLRYVKR